jgi:hypothetical protein
MNGRPILTGRLGAGLFNAWDIQKPEQVVNACEGGPWGGRWAVRPARG